MLKKTDDLVREGVPNSEEQGCKDAGMEDESSTTRIAIPALLCLDKYSQLGNLQKIKIF